MADDTREVVIIDIKMKFWSMVWFMVKWVIASIPALIILVTIMIIVSTIWGALFIGSWLGPTPI